ATSMFTWETQARRRDGPVSGRSVHCTTLRDREHAGPRPGWSRAGFFVAPRGVFLPSPRLRGEGAGVRGRDTNQWGFRFNLVGFRRVPSPPTPLPASGERGEMRPHRRPLSPQAGRGGKGGPQPRPLSPAGTGEKNHVVCTHIQLVRNPPYNYSKWDRR